MTPEEIDALEPARALAVLVARLVMGCSVVTPEDEPDQPRCGCSERPAAHADFAYDSGGFLRSYSTVLDDAWHVVDHLSARFWFMLSDQMPTAGQQVAGSRSCAAFIDRHGTVVGYGATPALAICRAALLAVTERR